jgi:hypothetical protein
MRQIGVLVGIQGCSGHDHARGAKAALKCVCIQECLLHRV